MNTAWTREAGFFLWDDQALFVAPALDADWHVHHGMELCLALDGSLTLCHGNVEQRGLAGALIGPHVPHRLTFDCNWMAVFIVGPLTSTGLALRARLGDRVAMGLAERDLEERRANALDLLHLPSLDGANRVCGDLVAVLSPASTSANPDGRVMSALDLLWNTYTQSLPAREISGAVGLSESHFGHLFRRYVGMPLRSYRRWLRLRAGMTLALSGADLTTAAHEVGFADLPEFTRVCRRSFGLPPSSITQFDTFFDTATSRPRLDRPDVVVRLS